MAAKRRQDGFYEYTSADEVRTRAQTSQRKLAAKKVTTEPVVVVGRKLVQTWWGEAWIQNLEHYADFANRLGRGRSYVRAGAIIDLKILPGVIHAKVQGSRVRPYTVQIEIKPLPEEQVNRLSEECSGKLLSMESLLDGRFPKDLAEQFLVPGKGLFPAPREISVMCSCPDWAVMCKHVAAVFYGVGVRLDEKPNLFFVLRQIDLGCFLERALRKHAEATLTNDSKPAGHERVMDISQADLSQLFSLAQETNVNPKTLIDPQPATATGGDLHANHPNEQTTQELPVKRRPGRPRKNPL